MNVGAVFSSLNVRDISRIRLNFPPLPEQKAIAEVLGALDDKVSSNVTLIRALLSVINAEFARLFSARKIALPLGALAEIVDCLHSKKPERVARGAALMQLNNIRDDGLVDPSPRYCIAAEDYSAWSRKFETRPWDFVVTNVGRIGAVARIPVGYVAALGRNMTGVRPRDAEESGSFIAAALQSGAVRKEIDRRTDEGSVMSALNVRSIPLLRLQDSSAEERRRFHQFASPLFEASDHALAESRTLGATRDTLLPQLMSGKLRVRDAERIAEEAGV